MADNTAQAALHQLSGDNADEAALSALARSEVLLPDPSPAGPEDDGSREVQLPVFEQTDGAKLVPVFTSEDRLAQALPEIQRYRTVQLALLGTNWPSDDLVLAIDAGATDGLTFSAAGVRALPALAGV